MPTGNPFTSGSSAQTMLPTDYTVQQQQLMRQQAMADLLRKQSLEPMGDTQSIGGWAIQKSPLEGLAKMAQALGANYSQSQTDEKQLALAKQLREQGVNDMQGVMGAIQGTPEQSATYQADNPFNEQLPEGMQTVTPAVAGDRKQAMALALQSQNPMVQGIGAKLMENELKAPEYINVNGQMVNKFDATPKGSVIPKQKEDFSLKPGESRFGADGKPIVSTTDYNKPFNADGTPNADYQKFEISKHKAGAPSMTAINNVNAFEPFKNKVQGDMGVALVKNFETLQNIPQTLQALDAAKENLAKAGNFVGSGAETKLAVAKFFNNNLGTTIDPTGVKNTEALQSALFYNVMDNLKKMDASPSQQQQKVMQDAFGRITTDPAALPMIIDFYKNQVVSKANEHNRRVDETTAGPSGMQFPYDIHVKVPQQKTGGSSVDALLKKYGG